MTERVTLHLFQALASNQCGLLVGDNCTGKTETLISLCTTLAHNYYIWPCRGDGFTYQTIGRIIKGCASSGCLIALDDINQLGTELMSQLIHSISIVREAIFTG